MRMMKSNMSIPMVRGFGVLYSKDIIDPSFTIYLLLPKIFAERASQVRVKRVAVSGRVTVENGAERYRQVIFWPRQACQRNYLASSSSGMGDSNPMATTLIPAFLGHDLLLRNPRPFSPDSTDHLILAVRMAAREMKPQFQAWV
jgi:hypothetical protein